MEANTSSSQSIREGRIQKLTDLIDLGVNPYPYTFDKTANAKTLQEKYKDFGNTTRKKLAFLWSSNQ